MISKPDKTKLLVMGVFNSGLGKLNNENKEYIVPFGDTAQRRKRKSKQTNGLHSQNNIFAINTFFFF